jgi:early secretory antigenic target protein ESAT-6
MPTGFDGLLVNHAGLHQAAQDLDDGVRAIDSRMHQLEQDLAPLRGQWAGNAQQTYVAAMATWDRAIEEMKLLLADTSRTITQSSGEYAAADNRGAAAFQV